jgi:hypothetical protein
VRGPRVEALPIEWEARAENLARWGGDAGLVQAWREAARELTARLSAHRLEELTPAEAAEESGYTVSGLAKLAQRGELRRSVTWPRPRYRRCDLPRKATAPEPTGPALVDPNDPVESLYRAVPSQRP